MMQQNPVDDLYREVLLDHHRHPHGSGELSRVDAEARGKNTSCGDEVVMQIQLDGDRIVDLAIQSQGCAVSTASGSMLADLLKGRRLSEARALADVFMGVMKGNELSPDIDLGDLEALVGVRKFPVRIKCAVLPWVTLLDKVLKQTESQELHNDRI